MSKKIRKPWCICKGVSLNPLVVGRVVEKRGRIVSVKYSDKQNDPVVETWDKKHLERFKTIKEAVKEFINHPKNKGRGKLIRKIVKRKFPSAFTKEDSV